MKVDQQWVMDNFETVDKIFTRLNKEETTANKSYHRKKMKGNMDRPAYRGYYELARKQEKDKVNKSKTIGDQVEKIRMDQVVEANASNTRNAIDLLEDQLDDMKELMNKQLSEKDKQIASLLRTIESITSISQMKSLSVS